MCRPFFILISTLRLKRQRIQFALAKDANPILEQQGRANAVSIGESSRKASIVDPCLSAGGTLFLQERHVAALAPCDLQNRLGALAVAFGHVRTLSVDHAPVLLKLRGRSRSGQTAHAFGANGDEFKALFQILDPLAGLAFSVVSAGFAQKACTDDQFFQSSHLSFCTFSHIFIFFNFF